MQISILTNNYNIWVFKKINSDIYNTFTRKIKTILNSKIEMKISIGYFGLEKQRQKESDREQD